jgi:hypothetical protein
VGYNGNVVMKRVLLILVISLLFVSGWGVVLADTLCPHKQARRAQQRTESAMAHGQRPSCHAEMAMDDAENAGATSAEDEERISVTGHTGLCNHCVSRPENQTNLFIFARGTEQTKRDAAAPLLPAANSLSPFASSFAPPVRARQHAPPVKLARRHLLLSIFLI